MSDDFPDEKSSLNNFLDNFSDEQLLELAINIHDPSPEVSYKTLLVGNEDKVTSLEQNFLKDSLFSGDNGEEVRKCIFSEKDGVELIEKAFA